MKKSVDVKYIQFLKFSVDVGSIKKVSLRLQLTPSSQYLCIWLPVFDLF